jgi:hypothetical protein
MIGQLYPTNEWERIRIGKATASKISVILTAGKRKMTPDELAARPKKGKGSSAELVEDFSILSVGTQTYVREKAAEIQTGTYRSLETFSTDWGRTQEEIAIEKLKPFYPGLIHYGSNNQKFFQYTDFSGGSPDAVQSATRVFEIKSPENPANHEEYLDFETAEDVMNGYYEAYCQIQMNMACVAKENKIDFSEMEGVFVSWCPYYLEERLQLHTVIIPPDYEMKKRIDSAIESFEIALAERIQKRNLKAVA